MQDDEPLIDIDVDSAGFPVMLVVVVVVLAGVSILVYRTYCRKSFTGARATLCRWLRSRIHSRCGCGVCAVWANWQGWWSVSLDTAPHSLTPRCLKRYLIAARQQHHERRLQPFRL